MTLLLPAIHMKSIRSFFLLLGVLISHSWAMAQPTFSQVFSPSTIGPGSSTYLIYTITNGSGSPITDLAFTNTLPAGVTLDDPALASTDCFGATLSAPAGGTTITFSGGIGAFSSCTVQVAVTSSTPGTHMNVSGDLISSAGNSGSSSDDLTVDAGRPGVSMSIGPSSIIEDRRSTLTVMIDNSLVGTNTSLISTGVTLPSNIEFASPDFSTNNCGGSLIVDANSISLFSGSLTSGSTCSFSIDITSSVPGSYDFVTSELESSWGGGGFSTAELEVTNTNFSKTFLNDPVPPGGTVDLQFEITNVDRDFTATNVSFTDDLDAVVSGLMAIGLPTSACGGTLTGTSTLSLTGGSIPSGETCTFTVTLQVPAGATPGQYINTTSNITYDLGGSPMVDPPAEDDLFIQNAPILTKTFSNSPVVPGDLITMDFSITNPDALNSLTDITFSDALSQTPAVVIGLPAPGFCGGGSLAFVTSGGTPTLMILNANLAAGASCNFSIDLSIPDDAPMGTYTNTTSFITGTSTGETVTGAPASDDLTIVTAPDLRKTFSVEQTMAGSTVDLTFDLILSENAPTDATSISFTDDLSAFITGATFGMVTSNSCMGGNPMISGGNSLTFSGATLSAGESCQFTIEVNIPAGAAPGSYTNTTSDISATVDGISTTNTAASDDLLISPLLFTKTFTDDPVEPGSQVTLEFTIDNQGMSDATGMFFTDNLAGALSGLAAVAPFPTEPCGVGSSISGTTFLIFVGGNLTAGNSCTFNVTLQVPPGASPGDYQNVTSNLGGTYGGTGFTGSVASDILIVEEDMPDSLYLSKSFSSNSVVAGGSFQLTFDLSYLGGMPATNISFTDDLGSIISGMSATSIVSNTCSVTPTLGSMISFSGQTLADQGACSFTVNVDVPASASAGDYTNMTSIATADGGITSAVATADFSVSENQRPDPVADAGPDQMIGCHPVAGAMVMLDGSASTHVANLSYEWMEGGMIIAMGAMPTVTLASGMHEIVLRVYDDLGVDDTDTMYVDVANIVDTNNDMMCDPVANAGPDQVIGCHPVAGAMVMLDGSGSTSENPPLSYSWSMNGMEFSTMESPSLTLPTGVHIITLTVSDVGGSSMDQVMITVQDIVDTDGDGMCDPVADAGPDQTFDCIDLNGNEVMLDGSGSISDNPPTSYSWQLNGMEIANTEMATVTLGGGMHEIVLIVTDGGGSDMDTVNVNIENTGGSDADGDGVCDLFDNCEQYNPDQADADCDGVGDVCDECPGGDDMVDNNGDNLPDCAYPPAVDEIIPEWKFRTRILICHFKNGRGSTEVISPAFLNIHLSHGDYLGPCGSANCAELKVRSQALGIYPVPFEDVLNVSFETKQGGEIRIAMMDALGRLVVDEAQIQVQHAGVVQHQISTAMIPAGTYIMVVTLPSGERITETLVGVK